MAFWLFDSAAVCDKQEGSKGSTGSGKDVFRLGEALAYLANMRTFWMITVGVGELLLISSRIHSISSVVTLQHNYMCSMHEQPSPQPSQDGSSVRRHSAQTGPPL